MMKRKLASALTLSVAALPATAVAQSVPRLEEGVFANRGQCESALHRVRNLVREQLRPQFRPNVVNRIIRENVFCGRQGDGYVIFAPAP